MRFIDEATISVTGGHGGPGCIAFHREKYVPRGGPSGGDGGKGGDVRFVSTPQLSTLQDFRFKKKYTADSGRPGLGSNKAGRDADDIEVKVPVGTIIRDKETNEVLFDFTEGGQVWFAAKGGRGGKGNSHFATATFQAPKFAQPGEEGEHRELTLELKLLADVAIIGYPNAGKSTLISRVSAARPKIADYAFTTLSPNLGVVSLPEYKSFVIADIPGLIEGAHWGRGLGTKFLKHIERTRFFIHLLDGTILLDAATKPKHKTFEESFENACEELLRAYKAIRQELELFSEALIHKPEIVVLNKTDILPPELVEMARARIRQELNSIRGVHPLKNEPLAISAVSGSGIHEMMGMVQEQLEIAKAAAEPPAPLRLPSGEPVPAQESHA